MQKNKIALITYTERGSYGSVVPDEDEMVLNALTEAGFEASLEVWTDEHLDWKNFDLVLIKSPWDYFNRVQEWYAWLDTLESMQVKVMNPVNMLRWNSDKGYLITMQERGLHIVPTGLLNQADQVSDHFFSHFNTQKIVIKPQVSGGAKQTFVLDQSEFNAKLDELKQLVSEEAYLIQPFLEVIAMQGEVSLVFFEGKFSHALVKTPKQGDFRVQHYFGGSIESIQPDAALLAQGQRVIDTMAADSLYARVDGLVLNGQLHIMELELIEPYLFLFTHPQALNNYVQAIKNQLNVE